MEPEQFKRGKRFHRRVQVDWEGFIENALVSPEHYVKLDSPLITKSGRIDIFVNKIEDFVSVFELKSTDWDRIKLANRRKLLGAHKRQILRYVDKYLGIDKVNVVAAIVYPKEPVDKSIKEAVEQYLNEHGLQVMWYE
jgi:hypothetical protein